MRGTVVPVSNQAPSAWETREMQVHPRGQLNQDTAKLRKAALWGPAHRGHHTECATPSVTGSTSPSSVD